MRFLEIDGELKRPQIDIHIEKYLDKLFVEHQANNADKEARKKTKETFYQGSARMKAFSMLHEYMENLRDSSCYGDESSDFLYAKLMKLELEYFNSLSKRSLRRDIKEVLGVDNATRSDFTLEETGKVLKVTRERVRQIENSVFSKIKHPKQKLLRRDANYE